MSDQDPYTAARSAAGRIGGQALYLAAGVADTVLERAEAAARAMRGLAARSDLADLVEDGLSSLTARGRIAVRRVSQTPETNMEHLARRAAAHADAAGADA